MCTREYLYCLLADDAEEDPWGGKAPFSYTGGSRAVSARGKASAGRLEDDGPDASGLLLFVLCFEDADPGVVHPGAPIGGAHDDPSDEAVLTVSDLSVPPPSSFDAGVFPIIGKIWSSLAPPSASLTDGLPNPLSSKRSSPPLARAVFKIRGWGREMRAEGP